MTKREIFYIVGIVMNPLIIFFGFSFLQLSSFNEGALIGIKSSILYYIFFVLVTMIIYSLLNDLWKAYFMCTIFTFLFHITNYYKLKITGLSLTPADVKFISNLKDIIAFVQLKLDFKIVMCLVLLFLALVLMYFCIKPLKKYLERLNFKRIWIFIYSSLIFSTFFLSPLGKYIIINFLDIKNEKDSHYVFDKEQLEKEYSKEKMKDILKQVEKSIDNNSNFSNHVEKPNVIVIMSEAFWDPTRLKNISFSSEPIKNFKELSKTNISGNILSPVIGGVTANVEYEFLVGNSIYFVDGMDVPYEQHKKYIQGKDNRAVPWQFKNNGYKTIAIHPFNKFFYNRNLIYPKLGFDEFISLSDMDEPTIKGKYVSDEYFTDTIIKTIEKSNEPIFLFGISMENHYPYNSDKFSKTDMTANSVYLNQTTELNSYLQGVYDADKSLNNLIQYLEKQEKPTLVFFFGDHLPLIGFNPMDFYYNAGYISTPTVSNWNVLDVKKMYSTPYLLWANYEIPKLQLNDFSPIYIGPILLDLANINKNSYYNYLLKMQKHVPVLHRDIYINQDGTLYKTPINEDKKWINQLFYIQYDFFSYKDKT